jgi:hypothetical protein
MTRNNILKTFKNALVNWNLMTASQKNLSENPINTYQPPVDGDWIRLYVGYGDVFGGELGGGIDIEGGIAFIDVFTHKGSGDIPGNTYAESLRDLFKDTDITYNDGLTTHTVPCQQVDIEPLGVEIEGNYNHTQVRVYFYNFVS